MPLAFCLKGGRTRMYTSGAGYPSRDVAIHLHICFLHNIAIDLDGCLPYIRIQFGESTFRSNLARKTDCERPVFEFDGRIIILKIHKDLTEEDYPDISFQLFTKLGCEDILSKSNARCLGTGRLPIGHYACENIHICSIPLFSCQQKVADLNISVVPGIPVISRYLSRCDSPSNSDSHSLSSTTSRPGVSFRFLRKDKTKFKKPSSAVEDFVNIIFFGADHCPKQFGSIILALLDFFKNEAGRLQFYSHLNCAVQTEHNIDACGFQTLVDVFRAVLREANNHRDFITCRKFKELSMRIKLATSDGESFLFLYSFIKDHEVFKNILFWEQFFLDVCANQRAELESTRDWINSTPHQPNLSTDETEEGAECILLILHLLCIFAWRILNAGLCADIAVAFCVDMCLLNSIPCDVIPFLKRFVRLLSFRTPYNIHAAPFLKSSQKHYDAPSSPEEIKHAISLNILKTPCCDLLSVLEQADHTQKMCLHPRAITGQRRPSNVGKLDLNCAVSSEGCFLASQDPYHDNESESEIYLPLDNRDPVLLHPVSDFNPCDPSYDRNQQSSPYLSFGSALVNGEVVLRTLYAVIDENSLTRPKGSLLLTTYRLIFVRDSKEASDCPSHLSPSPSIIGYDSTIGVHSILKFVVKPSESSGDDKILSITLKDNQVLRFRLLAITLPASKMNRDQMISEFAGLVHWAAWPQNLDQLFAFRYKLSISVPDDGWNIYTAEKEYQRMGVTFSPHWRRVTLNTKFRFSPTYPSLLFVPSTSTNEALRKVAFFRCRSRIPVLSYFIPDSGAALMRSAQPRTGVTGSHCVEDEQLIAAAKIRYIIDCRPKINARGNKVLGGGFESANRYTNCEVVFMGIENIHVVRDAFRIMVETVAGNAPSDIKMGDSQVSDLSWNKHLRQILLAAIFTATKLSFEKASLLVHCSDGWDRTSQVVSLAMLLIDEYYRTLSGFIVLIEKEWLSFGHKFHRRIGHGDAMYSDTQRSPIFIQFLDVVWQLMSQCPNAFEFNTDLLLRIAHELFECRFGTFLCNSEKERTNIHLRNKTVSLWTCIMSQKQNYLNPTYQPVYGMVQPNCNLNAFVVFPFYFRFRTQALQHCNAESKPYRRPESERGDYEEWITNFRQRESVLMRAVAVLQSSRDGLIPEDKTDWMQLLGSYGISFSEKFCLEHTPPNSPALVLAPPSTNDLTAGQDDSSSSSDRNHRLRRKRAKSA